MNTTNIPQMPHYYERSKSFEMIPEHRAIIWATKHRGTQYMEKVTVPLLKKNILFQKIPWFSEDLNKRTVIKNLKHKYVRKSRLLIWCIFLKKWKNKIVWKPVNFNLPDIYAYWILKTKKYIVLTVPLGSIRFTYLVRLHMLLH